MAQRLEALYRRIVASLRGRLLLFLLFPLLSASIVSVVLDYRNGLRTANDAYDHALASATAALATLITAQQSSGQAVDIPRAANTVLRSDPVDTVYYAVLDDTGARPRPRPTALGPQTAIVVGPQGQTSPQGADELYTDRLGRIKVQFHWQANPFAPPERQNGAHSDHSCWLRVMQRFATAGGGHQFIPRIGQEVLVGFLGNDIDRPLVIAKQKAGCITHPAFFVISAPPTQAAQSRLTLTA